MELTPLNSEVKQWMIATLQHSCHIEYFLEKLNIGEHDSQRPHDLVGPGNKYEWEVIKGFALQYRDPKPDFMTHIMPALNLHRAQYHHQQWNEPNNTATRNDMLLGAIDACCSLLESRGYQGGSHDYEGVIEVAKNNPPHKTPWMLEIIPEMRAIEQPKLELITSLHNFPNIGLTNKKYEAIVQRTNEAVSELKKKHYYL